MRSRSSTCSAAPTRAVHGTPLEFLAFTGTTDARAFVVHDATPATCYGPIGGNLHAPDEWVDLESVQDDDARARAGGGGVVRLTRVTHDDRHALLREAAHRRQLRRPPPSSPIVFATSSPGRTEPPAIARSMPS